MRGKKFSNGFNAALAILTVALFATSLWASDEKVLHSFGNGTDGINGPNNWVSQGSLLMDAAGNLYGTTTYGGIHGCYDYYQDTGCGTVFKLSPSQDGSWTEKVLHSFGNGTDGTYPYGGLIFDAAGNLYGTTSQGGIHSCDWMGCGTVFELSPNQDGSWTEKVLHSFGDGTDGAHPYASLIFDAAGNLYGTTSAGGIHNNCAYGTCGTVFELSPREDGRWTERVLHSFDTDRYGFSPSASLVLDAAGNLYGTAGGGDVGYGTVFELSPNQDGSWTDLVRHNFGRGGEDGGGPMGNLIIDDAGNLYGTTSGGGIHDGGTAFELSPTGGNGLWTETVLHGFGNGQGTDGAGPAAGLIFDGAGNLYGTTSGGGIHQTCPSLPPFNRCGTVFELSPRQDGGWTETVLHSFDGTDGADPAAGLIFDAAGNLYSTTAGGGIHQCSNNWGTFGCGTVFKIRP